MATHVCVPVQIPTRYYDVMEVKRVNTQQKILDGEAGTIEGLLSPWTNNGCWGGSKSPLIVTNW